MPRKLEADRWLFLVTLALCLIGTVMVFSASAVTAREEYGSAYYFLWRQLIWLVLGLIAMFATMSFDYRRLRQPHLP
jgi:cell division protein FtsW